MLLKIGYKEALSAEQRREIADFLPYHLKYDCQSEFRGQVLVLELSRQCDAMQVMESVRELISKTNQNRFSNLDAQLFQSEDLPAIVKEDPYQTYTEKGDVRQTGAGQYAYSGDFLILFDALDHFLESQCLKMGAKRQRYPTCVSAEELENVGYLTSFPHNANFVSHAAYDLNAIEKIKKGELSQEQLAPPKLVLAPTVCHHCFSVLKNSSLNSNTAYTALNKCHRHESSGVRGLERLTTYWMREYMAYGDETSIVNALEELLSFTREFLEQLNISYSLYNACDPFFKGSANSKKMFQATFALKREIKLMNHSGKLMAVASFNNHQTSLTPKYDIVSDTGAVSSSCVGWGYERLLYGLTCQLGTSLADWPPAAKKLLQL